MRYTNCSASSSCHETRDHFDLGWVRHTGLDIHLCSQETSRDRHQVDVSSIHHFVGTTLNLHNEHASFHHLDDGDHADDLIATARRIFGTAFSWYSLPGLPAGQCVEHIRRGTPGKREKYDLARVDGRVAGFPPS